jgi:two-component system sensor histidine kinase SenX3
METIHVALITLGFGVLVGLGMALVVHLSYRAREQAQAEISTIVPPGVAAMLASMDDAASVLDSSFVVLASSSAAARYGVVVDTILSNPQLRGLLRKARDSGKPRTETMRISSAGPLPDARLISARASVLAPSLLLLVIRDKTAQERLDQMRSDFVANTSHELKTPVGALMLLAEAIEAAADDPEQVRVFSGRLLAEATRLKTLTGRILTLSRLQAATGIAETELVSIDEVVASSVDAHSVAADAAGVQLVRGGDRDIRIKGDTHILIEAVGNLVANAIAYSPRGSRVAIGVSANDEVVEIAVSDQGIGVSPEDQERVFERFYRADAARSSRTGGTGLGLSIVRHATQHHGGEVRLWSQPGRGSTFTIRLPRTQELTQKTNGKKKKKAQKR